MHNMPKFKQTAKIFFILFLSIILTGCSLFKTETRIPDGGIYKSVDSGKTWQQMVLVPTITDVRPTIATVNTIVLKADPQDRYALYIGTRENGLFYTYNGAISWYKAPVVPEAQVNDVAVDPQSKCIIYIASGSQVFKSTDCSRNWTGTYIENDPKILVTSLDINPTNTAVLYAGDVGGNVYKSIDYGKSWRTVARFNNSIMKILINPKDTANVYIATRTKGIKKTKDGGETWNDLEEKIKNFQGASNYAKLIFHEGEDKLYYASKYGILTSGDGGETWTDLKLLTPPRGADIYSIAVNPKNAKEIYYATDRTFYKSVDAGEHWSTNQLPTGRIANQLLIDPLEPNVMYMGVAAKR